MPKNTPETPSPAYRSMMKKWELPHDLLGGTIAMREAGERWLPKEEGEEHGRYQIRLNRSILYNAYRDTMERLTSKPFSHPVVVQGELEGRLADIEENADRVGRNLTNFAADVFFDGLAYGKSHILVDFPNIDGRKTLEDERRLQLRPAFTHLPALDVIGWRTRNSMGRQILSMLRYKETRIEEDDEYGEKEVHYIKIWTETEWSAFRWDDQKSEWLPHANGTHTFGSIPVVTFYTRRLNFFVAEPPLMSLAWENLHHWQSSSDQKNILRVARLPILFGRGFNAKEIEAGIKISTSSATLTQSQTSELKWVEHSGKAIDAGAEDIRRSEERMEVLGLQPLVERASTATATGSLIHEGRSQTSAQRWVRNMEDGLAQCYRFAAQWTGESLPEDFRIEIMSDFAISTKARENVAALIEARKLKEIPRRLFLEEIKRYGVISEMIDVNDVLSQLSSSDDDPDLNLIGIDE